MIVSEERSQQGQDALAEGKESAPKKSPVRALDLRSLKQMDSEHFNSPPKSDRQYRGGGWEEFEMKLGDFSPSVNSMPRSQGGSKSQRSSETITHRAVGDGEHDIDSRARAVQHEKVAGRKLSVAGSFSARRNSIKEMETFFPHGAVASSPLKAKETDSPRRTKGLVVRACPCVRV